MRISRRLTIGKPTAPALADLRGEVLPSGVAVLARDHESRVRCQERRVKAIQQKLDRLDEAFLYSESIDLPSYSRQRDKLRERSPRSSVTPKQSTNSTSKAS